MVAVEFWIKFLQKMMHTCQMTQIFGCRCDELGCDVMIMRQSGWCGVQGEVVKNTEINIVSGTSGIIF